MASSDVINKAAAAFKKEEQRREGAKAMTEYRTAQIAEEKKTARLRALRLARDAATDGAEPTPAPKAKKPRKSKSSG